MDKLLETIAVQAPGMAILAIVVIAFLKHLGKKDRAIDEIHRENLVAREQSRIVIEKNTVAATQNTAAMTNMTQVLRDFLKSSRNGGGGHHG